MHAGLLQASSITSDKIGAGEVTAGKIAAGAITATEIALSTVLSGNIADGQNILNTEAHYSDLVDSTMDIEDLEAGAGRAYAALDSDNYLISAILPGATLTMSGRDPGLYLDGNKMGYWDGDEWKVYINSEGYFYFDGDDDNYIAWDGTDIEVKATKGYLGSSTNYFNITDGNIQLKHNSLSNYLFIDEDNIIISDDAQGGGFQYGNWVGGSVMVKSKLGSSCGFYAREPAGNSLISAQVIASSGINLNFVTSSDSAYIRMAEATHEYIINDFDLTNCSLDNTNSVAADSLTGTVDSDILPSGTVKFLGKGQYTGQGVGTNPLQIPHGLGEVPNMILIFCTSALYPHIWSSDLLGGNGLSKSFGLTAADTNIDNVDDTNFYVSGYVGTNGMNISGYMYRWMAFKFM